jgi:hypothetical protein
MYFDSVPWPLIGECVRVTVSADTVRVFHGARELAVTGHGSASRP